MTLQHWIITNYFDQFKKWSTALLLFGLCCMLKSCKRPIWEFVTVYNILERISNFRLDCFCTCIQSYFSCFALWLAFTLMRNVAYIFIRIVSSSHKKAHCNWFAPVGVATDWSPQKAHFYPNISNIALVFYCSSKEKIWPLYVLACLLCMTWLHVKALIDLIAIKGF